MRQRDWPAADRQQSPSGTEWRGEVSDTNSWKGFFWFGDAHLVGIQGAKALISAEGKNESKGEKAKADNNRSQHKRLGQGVGHHTDRRIKPVGHQRRRTRCQ